jgi:hypothetical protein
VILLALLMALLAWHAYYFDVSMSRPRAKHQEAIGQAQGFLDLVCYHYYRMSSALLGVPEP